MKRIFDLLASGFGLLFISPVLVPVIFLIWWSDKHSPFYVATRVGKKGKPFRMVKLRSMVVGADTSGVDSTASNDRRITPIGKVIRRYKLDEIMQLWNVLLGDMSFVGPRPNVQREVDLYTDVERPLLDVKPGITDISSIVFSDEGDILKLHADPDIAYNQLIRPGKSILGLIYVDHQSFLLDLRLCVLTIVSIVGRRFALSAIHKILLQFDAPNDVIRMALRIDPLFPLPPPGADHVVTSRDGNPFV